MDKDENEDIEYISKSQLKRESHARQSLGEELVNLNSEQLARFQLPEPLLEAIQMAQNIKKHGAKKRQLQYIGKLMRDVDVEPIEEILDEIKGVSAQAIARQHRVEQWRDRLVNEGDAALQVLLNDYPHIDRQQVRQLVRNIQKESSANKPPKSYRELFKYLKEAL